MMLEHDKYNDLGKKLDEAKAVIGHPPNGSNGINNSKVPDKFRVAWDLKKVISHQIWKDGSQTFAGVDSYPPDQFGSEPLAKMDKIG